MKPHHFRKVENRSISLLLCQNWDRGERVILPKAFGGSIFFAPLFHYRPGRGTALYFDFSDRRQDYDHFEQHYSKHRHAVDSMLVKCETRAQQFLELSERANPKDFSKAYSLLLSIWPLIDFADIFGSFIPDQISPPLAKKAQRLRHQYDQLLSVGEKTFVSMAKKKLPASFSPIVQLLTKQEVESVRLPPDINRRKRGFIFYRGKLFADLRLETFARRRNITFDAAAGSSGPLRGTSVIQKKASGRVKVVFEHSQLRKVRPGDVLVAPMTTPDFVTAARRAAAIVTDEGGAMCHAAIVAREFGIVCIVGTKYATQVFQDGDQVEVDGNRGMVKLLTRR